MIGRRRPRQREVVRWHLPCQDNDGQPFVAGVYLLLQDEMCFFLALDFDKAGWCSEVLHVQELAGCAVVCWIPISIAG